MNEKIEFISNYKLSKNRIFILVLIFSIIIISGFYGKGWVMHIFEVFFILIVYKIYMRTRLLSVGFDETILSVETRKQKFIIDTSVKNNLNVISRKSSLTLKFKTKKGERGKVLVFEEDWKDFVSIQEKLRAFITKKTNKNSNKEEDKAENTGSLISFFLDLFD